MIGSINSAMDAFLDWTLRAGFVGFIAFVAVSLVVIGAVSAGIVFGAVWLFDRSPKFTLRKDEWECTEGHWEKQTSMMLIGKVLVPTTSRVYVCDNWRRK